MRLKITGLKKLLNKIGPRGKEKAFVPTEEQLDMIVGWWMDAIRNPKHQALSPDERGGNRDMAFGESLADFASRLSPNTERQIIKFGEALRREIKIHQMLPYARKGLIILSVDYHPDQILDDAAREAGIDVQMITFPWKTVMWVWPDKISVKHGYHADEEQLL